MQLNRLAYTICRPPGICLALETFTEIAGTVQPWIAKEFELHLGGSHSCPFTALLQQPGRGRLQMAPLRLAAMLKLPTFIETFQSKVK